MQCNRDHVDVREASSRSDTDIWQALLHPQRAQRLAARAAQPPQRPAPPHHQHPQRTDVRPAQRAQRPAVPHPQQAQRPAARPAQRAQRPAVPHPQQAQRPAARAAQPAQQVAAAPPQRAQRAPARPAAGGAPPPSPPATGRPRRPARPAASGAPRPPPPASGAPWPGAVRERAGTLARVASYRAATSPAHERAGTPAGIHGASQKRAQRPDAGPRDGGERQPVVYKWGWGSLDAPPVAPASRAK